MDYKHKYKKYKLKHNELKKHSNSLFAFIIENNLHDSNVIIVSALNENNAYDQLNNSNNPFIYKSTYANDVNIDELKKIIFNNNIKPIAVTTPLLFNFYNG